MQVRWFRDFFLVLAASAPLAAQSIGGCPSFPVNNVWNVRVDKLPPDPNSLLYTTTFGAFLHPDFSSDGGGIPFVIVNGLQPKVPVPLGAESDPGPYPIPPNAPIELGSDHHVLVLENTNCILYELFDATPQADGSWTAGSGAIFDMKANHLRPAFDTSADGAGLPILPGLVRYDEVMSGEIRHAIRVTVPHTRNSFIWPARHRASILTDLQYPPMGQRFRLRGDFDESSYSFEVQVILRALKKYGMIVADNGQAWFLTGAPDPRWSDGNLHRLHEVLGSYLEAVDESGLIVDPDSAAVNTNPDAIKAVLLTASQIAGGTSLLQNQVILSTAADPAGAIIQLQSSNPGVASAPPSVTVPPGATFATFSVSTGSVSAATPATITASYLGSTQNATVTVNPPAPACAPDVTSQFTITRSGFRLNSLRQYLQTITVQRTSGNPAALAGPFALVFDSLSANAALITAQGSTTCAIPAGRPYVLLAPPGGTWSIGQIVTVNLQFSNPSNAGITYNSQVLAGAPR